MKTRLLVLIVLGAVGAGVLAGCSTQARAERKGKAAGDAICKAKDSRNAAEAQRHVSTANRRLNELSRFTGRDVHQDVRNLNRNLNQLARGHGTEQDISAIIRSVQAARHTAYGNSLAAYDGLLEALANCD
jgi:hypothetical protein